MSGVPFRVEDRVTRISDGLWGTVHAVYPDDLEDDLEVLMDDGTYTCVHHTHFLGGEVNLAR